MDTQNQNRPDIEALRERLRSADAPQFWRSLNEIADTEEFREYIEDEFPNRAQLLDKMDRRQFMILAGASLALAGMTGCRWMPQEKAVPQVKAPEEYIPGLPLYYASALPFNGFARGVLVESHEGRPTKIEGNPDHPASLGSTDAFMQASILTLYDPDRSRNVKQENDIRTWEAFLDAVRPELEKQKAKGGAGLRILTGTITSPTFAAQVAALQKTYPQMTWHQYESISRDNLLEGANLAFGEYVQTTYDFTKATRVLALDSDFLSNLDGSVRYARDFATTRRVREDKREMSRLYAIESTPTLVGTMADHRRPARASEILNIAAALANRLGVSTGATDTLPASVNAEFLDAVVRDLQSARGASIIIAGEQQPPMVHALVHAMNAALGNAGATVLYSEPVEVQPVNNLDSLTQLVTAMQESKVDLLLMLGVNPVYTAPADLNFAQQLIKVPLRVHQGMYEDETSALCQWHIPDTHYLEAWGDIRAYNGTASIVQPLIQPLYEGKSAIELFSILAGEPRTGYDLVRETWRQRISADFQKNWDEALNKGVLPGTQAAAKTPTLNGDMSVTLPEPSSDIELIFRPDPTIWDGQYANNGWLQELPKPLTKLTWDNAVLISPRTAQKYALANEDRVVIRYNGLPKKEDGSPASVLEVPIILSFGHPDNAITLHLGYGRTRAGSVGTDKGFNFGVLRTSDAFNYGGGAKLENAGGQYALAYTEHHNNISPKTGKLDTQDGRNLIHVSDITVYQRDTSLGKTEGHGGGEAAEGEHGGEAETHAEGAPAAGHEAPAAEKKETSLFPETVGGSDDFINNPKHSFDYKDPDLNQWAMVIDLNTCIGCNACSIACQSENNIPVVGKWEVKKGREMHWIRIDRYYSGGIDNPRTYFQPMACQHCELAPCEPVCPVAATVHSHDGLNQMVYNRCIGTKYCSNNCPYKVRRFNFLNYANDFTYPVLMLQKNPDVTVRGRGVMEKCTYCIQRISEVRIEAKKAGRKIGGDEVVTACQQACPTQAIIFGDMNQPESQVAKARAQGQNYIPLEDLQTRPRTTYLARLRNLNPEIGEEA